MIRTKARTFPPAAFDFIRDGLSHTVSTIGKQPAPSDEGPAARPTGRHITGQQLCDGLRAMARERYGMLALTVLHRWGVRSTEDFGVMVYALIDRGEMRSSDEDRFDDFVECYDFDEAFAATV